MLNVHQLTISFQGEDLFENISFRLQSGHRVGLIGKNGAGKSTLLKIISGELEHNSGQISFEKKDLKIGFLKQDIDFVYGRTILEESYEAFSELKALERQLEKINTQLAERTDYESESYHNLMVDLNEVQQQYEILGGYNYQGETEKILIGLVSIILLAFGVIYFAYQYCCWRNYTFARYGYRTVFISIQFVGDSCAALGARALS